MWLWLAGFLCLIECSYRCCWRAGLANATEQAKYLVHRHWAGEKTALVFWAPLSAEMLCFAKAVNSEQLQLEIGNS